MSYKILIVDDETANLRLLERLFRRQYQVISASSGSEALELLVQHDIALIISDQRMPAMTGIEFLKRAAQLRQHTVRIILTGYTDVNSLVEVINSGVVYKYVTKPWVNEDLQQTVERALQHYETIKEQHKLKLHNERLKARVKAMQESFIRVITEVVGLKDPHAPGHCRRTSIYAAAVGQRFDLDPVQINQLSLAAFLHEAAHIYIPGKLLFKPTALTDDEQEAIRQNFERGVLLLEKVPELEEISLFIRYFREHYDGSGYPAGLAAEQIPLYSRIIAVTDAYDEMTSPRSQQPVRSHEEAMEYLREAAGIKFDPEVVRVFSELKSTAQGRNMMVEIGTNSSA